MHNGGRVKFINSFFTVLGIIPDDTYDAKALKPDFGPLPDLKKPAGRPQGANWCARSCGPGIRSRRNWSGSTETSAGIRGYDGGVMSTAGSLVFRGRGNVRALGLRRRHSRGCPRTSRLQTSFCATGSQAAGSPSHGCPCGRPATSSGRVIGLERLGVVGVVGDDA